MGVEQERLKRMMEIRGWLMGVKVCAFCALRQALIQTEREMGDRNWQPSSYICKESDFRGETCQEKIDRHWPELQEATLWARTAELMVSGFANSKAEPTSGTGSARPASMTSAPRPSHPASRHGSTSSPAVGSKATVRTARFGERKK